MVKPRNAAMALMILQLSAPQFARASESITGNEFISYCNAPETMKKTYCYGYVAGLLDGVAVGRAGSNPMFCLPPSVTVGQMTAMTLKALDDAPEVRHLPVRMTIAIQAAKTFPCAK